MAVFNGRYYWDGTRRDNLDPIAWFSGSYDLKIFELKNEEANGIEKLKTHICILSRTGEGQSIAAQPDKFAKRICYDFQLEMDRVIWIEDLLTEKNRYEVIVFTRTGKMRDIIFYRAERRYPHPWERHALLSALETVEDC